MELNNIIRPKMENQSQTEWFYFEPPLSDLPLSSIKWEFQTPSLDVFGSLGEFFNISTSDHPLQFNPTTDFILYDPPKDRDFDIDDLQWSVEDLSSTYEDLIVPLQKITNTDPIDHQVKQNIDVNICKVGCEKSTHDIGRRSNGRMRLSTVGLEEMSRHFYVPINQAAKEMNIGLTALKKRCRELGISRWPHRKMKSLRTLIHSVQELVKGNDEERLRREIEALKEQKALMEMWPEMDLSDRTKKLRQACFKANFTKRRIMGAP